MNTQFTVRNPLISGFDLGPEKKYLLTFDLEETGEVFKEELMHHIHILDRSGSMYAHISELMEDVKKTLRMIRPEDFVTIIWFSGPGEYRSVVKCARNDCESIDKVLDGLKSTVGCTCFSDPIKELEEIISETAAVCDSYNITIFTDGDTVTPWPVKEEHRRIFENLDAIGGKIVAFNAVGYGNYYNKELLKKMTETTEYGLLTHTSKISEYCNIFAINKAAAENFAKASAELVCAGSQIVFLTDTATKTAPETLKVRLGKRRNTLGVIADTEDALRGLAINGTPFHWDGAEYLSMDEVKSRGREVIDILYALAYNHYYGGRRKEALSVLDFLGDKSLLTRQYSAFTLEETGEYSKHLRSCVFSTSLRHAWEAPSGSFMPDDNALCIMDILKELSVKDAKYYPQQDYKRIGRKVTDGFDCFIKDASKDWAFMRDIVLSQDRLNISIRFEILGRVKLNPKRAANVGLPAEIPSRIYRVHTIVKDGQLNMEKLRVGLRVDINSEFLEKLGDSKDIISCDGSDMLLEIDLKAFPVINNSYLLDASASTFLKYERSLLELEAEQKVINRYIKAGDQHIPAGMEEYTPEQIEVLKEHGISKNMIYSGVDNAVQEALDFYVVKEFRTGIKGFSSLPAVGKAEEKIAQGKKLTPSEELMARYIAGCSILSGDERVIRKDEIKNLLGKLRFRLSGMKIALVLTGEWMDGLDAHPDGSYTYSESGTTLVIKLERKEIPV